MQLSKLYLLHRRQWAENKQFYLVATAGATGILLFLFFIVWHWRESFGGDAHRGIFLIILFGGGSVFASFMLKEISTKSKAIWLMQIPASSGEKLFIIACYSVLLYVLCFLVIFYITEGLFTWLTEGRPVYIDLLQNKFYYFLLQFIQFQLIILIGGLSFKRLALIKTLLLLLLIFSISNAANNWCLSVITGEKEINGGSIFSYFQFSHEGENVYVYLPDVAEIISNIFFRFFFPCLLYYIAYLKWRETEI